MHLWRGATGTSIPLWILLPFPVTPTQPVLVPHGRAHSPFLKPLTQLSQSCRGSLWWAQEGFPGCLHHHKITLPPFKSKRLLVLFPHRWTKLQLLAAVGANAADTQKDRLDVQLNYLPESSCEYMYGAQTAQNTTFPSYMLVSKGVSCTLCFNLKPLPFL